MHRIEALGKEMVVVGTPAQNHSQLTCQVLTAHPVPLPGGFPLSPNPPGWLFLTTPAHSEFCSSLSKLPWPLAMD